MTKKLDPMAALKKSMMAEFGQGMHIDGDSNLTFSANARVGIEVHFTGRWLNQYHDGEEFDFPAFWADFQAELEYVMRVGGGVDGDIEECELIQMKFIEVEE